MLYNKNKIKNTEECMAKIAEVLKVPYNPYGKNTLAEGEVITRKIIEIQKENERLAKQITNINTSIVNT